jgi:hypothetical protein
VCGWESTVIPNGINNHGQIIGTDESESGEFAWLLDLGAPVASSVTPPSPQEVPTALAVSIFGANPARGGVALRCALPEAGPATLDVLDVNGRRVASRTLPAGGEVLFVSLDETRSLPPGMYFARLSQGGHSRVTRVVLVR